MLELRRVFVIIFIASYARGYVAFYNTPNNLNPVHGLYVKPSPDGATGDLYVAATEDSGITQWLTDQPINFLPAASQPQATTAQAPVTFSSTFSTTHLPHDETVVTTQKRAIVNSPPMNFVYSYPTPGANAIPAAYPYALPAATASGGSKCSHTETAPTPVPAVQTVSPYPFHYFYPQIMSAAFSNAVGMLKENGLNDEAANSLLSRASGFWSPYSYPPYQYVTVDPNAWAHSQTATAQPSNSKEVETVESTTSIEAESTDDE